MADHNTTFIIHPGGTLQGPVRVPGDKSISHRAVMLGALADGETEVHGFLEGEDSLATLRAFRAMGVEVEGPRDGHLRIRGAGLDGLRAPPGPLDLGNSGTSMRLLAGILAAQPFDSVLQGDASLSRRPMARITHPLARMGARIETAPGGTPPLRIHGGRRLQGIDYVMPVASAQVKSCLLLAGLYAEGRTCVTEPAPTRDHTERMLASFGCEVLREAGRICVAGGGRLRATAIEVPGDISSAAFFMVGAAITPGAEVCLTGVGINPTRTGVVNILRAMGASLDIENERMAGGEPVGDIRVRASRLRGIVIPRDQVPLAIDEFPALFIAAACAEGETVLQGAAELRVKESDRIQVMADGLRALGVDARPTDDGMVIRGGRLGGGCVDSHGDHRIAMAFAMAGLRADGIIEIRDCANVATSFPGFVELARHAGLQINVMQSGKGSCTRPTSGTAMERSPREHSPPVITPPVITIDGPGGSGKGTVSRLLARRLGWHFLDSGALYRLVALAARHHDVALDDAAGLARLARNLDVRFEEDSDLDDVCIYLDGREVTGALREESCGEAASQVAALAPVREALLDRQRTFCRPPGLVADGRDMGTVVFPHAALKIFLTASAGERARRRYKQLKDKGMDVRLDSLLREIEARDARDRGRRHAPLKPAPDAVHIDTTSLTVEDVVARILALWRERSARASVPV